LHHLTCVVSDGGGAGGGDLKEAFENVIIAMSGYMTEISRVQIDPRKHKFVIAEGVRNPSAPTDAVC
jgi:hypothetical protein